MAFPRTKKQKRQQDAGVTGCWTTFTSRNDTQEVIVCQGKKRAPLQRPGQEKYLESREETRGMHDP
jgi:hypothetical protein